MWRDNCSRCGKFFRYEDVDSGTRFGTSGSLDPPEPELWCGSCAKKERAEAVRSGFIPPYWIKPRWVQDAAKQLGLRECGPIGAAWSIYTAGELPDGYEWRGIECDYCGHRYDPDTEVPASKADVLKEHVEQCSEHPMSALKRRAEETAKERDEARRERDQFKRSYETVKRLLESSEEREEHLRKERDEARREGLLRAVEIFELGKLEPKEFCLGIIRAEAGRSDD